MAAGAARGRRKLARRAQLRDSLEAFIKDKHLPIQLATMTVGRANPLEAIKMQREVCGHQGACTFIQGSAVPVYNVGQR